MARGYRRPAAPSASEMHRSWLELVDVDGPFLAIPPLTRVWPNGIPDFRSIHPERFAALADARKDFEMAWERVDQSPADEKALISYRISRDQWVQTLLRDVVGWKESLAWGDDGGLEAQSPSRTVSVAPQALLRDPEGAPAAIVSVIDPVDSLRETPSDGWAATPIDRLEELLRVSGVPIGIVTDGRWWAIVSAKAGSMQASGIVDSLTWVEEPRTRDAFLTILGRQYLIGGEPTERLPVLFEESIAAAEEITEALGVQVRRAVELLVQAFSESAAVAKHRGQPDPLPERSHEVYEAAVTIMMRTVFLLFAEERGLLPTGELFEQGYGLSGRLDRLSIREAEEGEESLDSTTMTWHRLLATSEALFNGATFESLRMPAYGGSLFDPARFPFLTATADDGTLTTTVSDRVMLHVLRSVQLAILKGGEARRISFRDIDVEQIGYIYEGLLGYTTVRVEETYVGLKGPTGAEPEIPLATLESLQQDNSDPKNFAKALREWVSKDQSAAKAQSESAIAKGLKAEIDSSLVSALSQAVGGDAGLRDRIKPFLGIIRQDLRSHPSVIVSGGLMVKETPSRKNAGAHYTPKSLAEEVVLHALQHLCYSPGPHQTGNEAEWRLRASEEILDLKVADIACGSGAFLVASARYLADRVVEAWIAEDPDNALRKDLHVRAIRQVVANCLYGADINEMAVEMAKLSLWLVSLDRDLPFSFVDDKIFLGNSLLGLTSLDQLRALHIDPANASRQDALSDAHVDVDAVVRKAIELRERLASEIDEDDPMRSTTAKRRQFEQLQAVTAELRMLADGVIAAGLPFGGKPGKALDEAYQNLRLAVKQAQPVTSGGASNASWLDAIIDVGLTPTVETDYERWQPLHWVLEVPDVLVDHGGFDAVLGNPPFLAGKKIAIASGPNVEAWTKIDVGQLRGAADISAHFARRGWRLLRDTGTVGLIMVDRVGIGDTALMSTRVMDTEGCLYRGVSRFDWPGAASTGASIVWAVKGLRQLPADVIRLDGEVVSRLSPSLQRDNEPDVSKAVKLDYGIQAGTGVSFYGDGFLVAEGDPLLERLSDDERRNLRPYVNGQSLMSGRPSGRFVIDVNTLATEEELFRAVPIIGGHLASTVQPLRAKITSQIHESRYWAHWDKREALFQAASVCGQFIVLARDTRVPVFMFANDHHALYSDTVVVIASSRQALLGVLSSVVHTSWLEKLGNTRGKNIRYVVSRVFRTFPLPDLEAPKLLEASIDYQQYRAAALKHYGSMTALWNAVDDPGVADARVKALRESIVRLDIDACRAYGWDELELDHCFDVIGESRRYTVGRETRLQLRRLILERNEEMARVGAVSGYQNIHRKSNEQTHESGGTLW